MYGVRFSWLQASVYRIIMCSHQMLCRQVCIYHIHKHILYNILLYKYIEYSTNDV